MAQKFEKAKNRTCVPAWNGSKHLRATMKHYNSNNITDEEAFYLLTNGYIAEECFSTLPAEYIEYKEAQLINTNTPGMGDELSGEELCIIEIKGLLDSGMTVKEIKSKYKDVKEIDGIECNDSKIAELIKVAKTIK